MKILFQSLCLALTALTLSTTVHAADDPQYSKEFAKCQDEADGVTPEILACNGAEWERQDKRLNKAYQALLKSLPAKKAEELRTVQRSWLTYKKAKCGFLYDSYYNTGSLDRIMASNCGLRETTWRAEELEQLNQP